MDRRVAQPDVKKGTNNMDKRTRNIVTAGLAIGLLAAALDQTVVDTAFPRMIADLGGVSIFTWVITIYMLASTAVVPVVGKLADIFGRKVFYLVGMATFIGGSMLCGQAHSMAELIIFRGIQGLGAGMLQPIVFTLVGDIYPPEDRAKLQGLFGGVFGVASVLGPKIGGWLTHNLSWRWVFYVNFPIGVIAFLIILFGLKESRGARRPIDYWGSITVTAGIVAILLALSMGGTTYAWNSWQMVSLFAVAIVLLIAFVGIESRVPEPILSFALFKKRTYSVMSLVALLMGIGMFGTIIFVPWFIQGVVGVDPNVAGNVMTPMMFTVIVFSFTAGRLAVRIPYRLIASSGFLLLAVGFLLMTRWTASTTQLQAIVATMVVGAGVGLLMPTMTLATQNAFGARFRGQVTSGIQFFRSVGGTLGTTIFGMIFNQQMGNNLPLLNAKLQPILANVPPAALAQFGQHIQAMTAQPQALVQVLLQEQLRAQIPALMRGAMVAGIKEMMVDSLHLVFFTGMLIVLGGFVVSLFLGNTSLKTQKKELESQGESGAKGDMGSMAH